MDNEQDFIFKIILIGNTYVGKSPFMYRFCSQAYQDKPLSTIGVEYGTRALKIQEKQVKLKVWDFPGGKRMTDPIKKHYRGAHAIILCYDITDRQSFTDILSWLQDSSKYVNKDVTYVLVGNKSDLEEHREVPFEEGKAFADSLNMKFFESSVKNNYNVETVFMYLVQYLLAKESKIGIIQAINFHDETSILIQCG